MSHFNVTVVTPGEPTEEVLARTLLPWHEFECTGYDNEYVRDIDETEEYRERWKKEKDCPLSFRDWVADYTGRGIILPGQEPDLGEAHKYGFILVDGRGEVVRVVDRTNPDRKWDWWTVGGRWKNRLAHRNGSRADSLRYRDLDAGRMEEEARGKARDLWRRYHAVVRGRRVPVWSEVLQRHEDIEAARAEYHADPVVQALKDVELDSRHISEDDCNDLPRLSLEDFCAAKARAALPTFALVLDGRWHERGEMGWFACVRDEKDRLAWSEEFLRLLGGVSPTDWLTVVDCHI